VAILIAVVRVLPAERPLRLVDSGADRRPDLLPCCPGLGLGVVRRRGDRLAHILRASVARPTAPTPVAAVAIPVTPVPVAVAAPTASIRIAIAVATMPISISAMTIPVAAVPAVAAPVAIATSASPVSMAAPVAMVAAPVAAVPAVAVSVAALAGIRPPLASTAAVPASAAAAATAAAFRVGDVVMDRREWNRQATKEWDECNHEGCQDKGPEERCHGWPPLSMNHYHR
jgi:hypothetical protein